MPERSKSDPLEKMGKALHQRLLDGDATAPAEIAELFMPIIIGRLSRRYRNLDDPHLIDTAVEDALMSYFARPQQYDPSKLSLAGYLRMSAKGDLLNLLKQETRTADRQTPIGYVELPSNHAEHGVEVEDDFDLEAFVFARRSPVWQLLSDLLPDPVDQEIVLLMMEGIRETSVYASVLSISDRPREEQARIVKRHKDRLKKKLQRNIEPSEVKGNV
jgi:DNA-directed RNA polymerase specialized sigma24 family protein